MNNVKTVILLGSLTGLLILIGGYFGGRSGVVIAFTFAMVLNFGSYWFSDKIVLKMYKAREVSEATSPELYSMVRDLALRAGLPMPRLYIVPGSAPNAFATGRNEKHAAVAVTEGIIGLLSRDELEGVLAHELTHIKNKDILISSIAATVAGAIMMLASMARWAAIFGGGRDDADEGGGIFGLIIMAILAPIAATIIQMAISRAREYLADEGGARISGKSSGLANALEKLSQVSKTTPMKVNPSTAHMFIVKPFTGRSMANLFSTHPPVEKRVERLMAMRQV